MLANGLYIQLTESKIIHCDSLATMLVMPFTVSVLMGGVKVTVLKEVPSIFIQTIACLPIFRLQSSSSCFRVQLKSAICGEGNRGL